MASYRAGDVAALFVRVRADRRFGFRLAKAALLPERM